jgi:hypothetical protein
METPAVFPSGIANTGQSELGLAVSVEPGIGDRAATFLPSSGGGSVKGTLNIRHLSRQRAYPCRFFVALKKTLP